MMIGYHCFLMKFRCHFSVFEGGGGGTKGVRLNGKKVRKLSKKRIDSGK